MSLFRKPDRSADPLPFDAVAKLRAEIQALKAGRSQIEEILQSMAEGVLVVDPAGRLHLINHSAREILGMGFVAQAGQALAEAVRQPGIQDVVRRVLKTRQAEVLEMELYSPRERVLEVRASICPVADVGECALLVFHDITGLKRLEKIRRDFVANVSHELKTPLTAIRGAVETLLDGALRDPTNGRPFVEAISEEAARLQRLMEDLLTLAQVESKQTLLRKEPVPLRGFLEQEISRHRPAAQARGVTVELEAPPEGKEVPADRGQLSQAVANLLDNAIKYNRSGGKVTVRVRLEPDQCRIEVQDSGLGIPPEDLPRIFERFYRVDKGRSSESGGTGLGLSIVKHVAEAHGGSVQVESRLDQGSLFTLILPL